MKIVHEDERQIVSVDYRGIVTIESKAGSRNAVSVAQLTSGRQLVMASSGSSSTRCIFVASSYNSFTSENFILLWFCIVVIFISAIPDVQFVSAQMEAKHAPVARFLSGEILRVRKSVIQVESRIGAIERRLWDLEGHTVEETIAMTTDLVTKFASRVDKLKEQIDTTLRKTEFPNVPEVP